MSTLADKLNEMSKELKGADRIKTASLINIKFVVKGYTVEDGEDREGNPKTSYVAHIILDGEEHEAWLDGVHVRQQLRMAKDEDAFPCLVKLEKDEMRYVLRFLESGDNGTTAAPLRASTHKAALGAYMKRHNIDAVSVLSFLGAPVPVGDNVRQAWSDYIEKMMAVGGANDEDDACRMMLATLTEAREAAQPDEEEIPF